MKKNKYLRRDRKISSVHDLLKNVTENTAWFRGESNKKFPLVPAIFRDQYSDKNESDLITRFRQHAPLFLQTKPQTTWDWLFLMQHYSVPTRLLDWTESPIIALYFAVKKDPKADAALWCLDPLRLNQLSSLSSITLFSSNSKDKEVVDRYLPEAEKGKGVSLTPIAGLAERNFLRMYTQFSVFTISSDNTPINFIASNALWRFIVPKNCKKNILKELEKLRVVEHTMFPDLNTISSSILSK